MSYAVKKRPEVTAQLATKLAKKHFGLEVVQVKELDSYDDRNFYLRTQEGEFVLKVTNSVETANLPLLEAENKAMLFLKNHGVNCNVPQASLSKMFVVVEELKENEPANAIRLFDFVHGQMVEDLGTFNDDMIYSLGQFVGKMDKILKV